MNVDLTIDKISPTCLVEYSPNTLTSGNVTATLTGCSEAISGATSHLFTSNGSHIFTFSDRIGNLGVAVAVVSRIDATPPTATNLSYLPDTDTNQDVTVTLETSEPIQALPGWTGTGTSWSRIYASNVSELLTFYDFAGNE